MHYVLGVDNYGLQLQVIETITLASVSFHHLARLYFAVTQLYARRRHAALSCVCERDAIRAGAEIDLVKAPRRAASRPRAMTTFCNFR